VKDVSPILIYKLVERIIRDAKLSGRQSKVSSSRMIERGRIEQFVNMLLSKISRDDTLITQHFLDSLVMTHQNLGEVPTYFKSVLRAKINGTINNAPKENETANEERRLNDEQLLSSLAAYRQFIGPLQANQSNKLVEYLKSEDGKINFKRLVRRYGS
jgi:hypothetical protein